MVVGGIRDCSLQCLLYRVSIVYSVEYYYRLYSFNTTVPMGI